MTFLASKLEHLKNDTHFRHDYTLTLILLTYTMTSG